MTCAGATLELLGHLITGQAWHHDIQQDQVRKRVTLKETQRFIAAVGRLDPVLVLEQVGNQHQVVGGVVDHQNGG
ncbi:hypothetical protein D3C72_2423740 [compost metagenome]